MSVKNLLAIVPLCVLVSCGWVDNTGRGSNTAPVTQISFADGQQLDASPLQELSSLVLNVRGTDSDGEVNMFAWSAEPVEQGALPQCADVPDFDMSIAADSLEAACGSNSDCKVTIDAQNNATADNDFLVSAPKLRAPVGVTYQLTATDNEGGTGTQRSTFCLIAVNEAPDVNDDTFTVLEGATLTVTAADVNLLTNDKEHDHVTNEDLRVLREPEVAPRLASAFTLGADGGFVYVAGLLADRSATAANDSFVYAVTDGVYEKTTATVTINVVAKNDPPVQITTIPLQMTAAGVLFESDLSAYFADPEGASLSFAIVDGSLPASGGLTLAATGVLGGTANLFDEGSYPITISVSDGAERREANLTIVITDNLPVGAESIEVQEIELGDTLSLDVSDYFTDPEGQDLVYSIGTTYRNATFDMDAATGILTANFTVEGRYTVDVFADDQVSAPSSIRFVIDVSSNNVVPTFRGQISNQTVELGEPINAVVGVFFDANGDELTYSVIGSIPAGLALSTRGVLTGTPTEVGIFRGIRLVATDPFNKFARSNAFFIEVEPSAVPIVNTPPRYVPGSVNNQGVRLGQPITPVRPEFEDSDNDVLVYRIAGGNLPIGVVIDPATGIVSGTPVRRVWVRGLRVIATDPSGATASTAEFWIRVL